MCGLLFVCVAFVFACFGFAPFCPRPLLFLVVDVLCFCCFVLVWVWFVIVCVFCWFIAASVFVGLCLLFVCCVCFVLL